MMEALLIGGLEHAAAVNMNKSQFGNGLEGGMGSLMM